MTAIELRLDPALVSSLMDSIQPALELLKDELASPALLPEEDEMLEDFWKNDLLNSQRSEVDVLSELFNVSFLESGRALIEPESMDRVLRACAAIRLKLRDTVLKVLSDEDLECGDFEDVSWNDELRLGYAAYSLFAGLQELIVSQMDGSGEPEREDGIDDEHPYL